MNYNNYKQRMREEQLKREQEILPIHHNRDDRQHILRKMALLPTNIRKEVSKIYSDIYIQAYNNEPNQVRKNNKARAAANGWLLHYTDDYLDP